MKIATAADVKFIGCGKRQKLTAEDTEVSARNRCVLGDLYGLLWRYWVIAIVCDLAAARQWTQSEVPFRSIHSTEWDEPIAHS
jgi:hypothetical protein